jgi:hypothetical protein
VVHRARMHRAAGLFELGEKTPMVKERWLVSKLPASDPSRSPPVDCDRSGFSFGHSVNVGGLHRGLPLNGPFLQTAVVVRDAELARRLWSRLEPIHVVTYFSPEVRAALSGAGYKGFWMGYFAGRAAPMGPVGPEVVFATFYNFSIAHVRRAIPDAWAFAPPSAALQAREQGSAAALRRAFAGKDLAGAVQTAAVLARAAAESAPMEGRVLFAANRALPWPAEPAAVLWQACTLLREHRGDGHVAALAAAGIGGPSARNNSVLPGTESVPEESVGSAAST